MSEELKPTTPQSAAIKLAMMSIDAERKMEAERDALRKRVEELEKWQDKAKSLLYEADDGDNGISFSLSDEIAAFLGKEKEQGEK